MSPEIQKYITSLRDLLHQWNYEYYVLSNPSVSDYEFDQKLKELEELEKKHPEFADDNSPSKRVGETSPKTLKR
jgi:DNA ligase (NAD+)